MVMGRRRLTRHHPENEEESLDVEGQNLMLKTFLIVL